MKPTFNHFNKLSTQPTLAVRPTSMGQAYEIINLDAESGTL